MKKKSASSPREKRLAASEVFTTPLSDREKSQLRKLANLPDSKIDLSDAPEAVSPSHIEVGRFYRPVKQLISLRLDADVLAWFRQQGPRYQTYINAVLRREAEANRGRG